MSHCLLFLHHGFLSSHHASRKISDGVPLVVYLILNLLGCLVYVLRPRSDRLNDLLSCLAPLVTASDFRDWLQGRIAASEAAVILDKISCQVG